ncbi:glycoside hydrolase superfamily [Lipomyces arxii]|uniref:glycoside hydrolase superfamily n=1 Tax=Lipomyces arxii TaxID=56418 RepID=UPI0034CE61A6
MSSFGSNASQTDGSDSNLRLKGPAMSERVRAPSPFDVRDYDYDENDQEMTNTTPLDRRFTVPPRPAPRPPALVYTEKSQRNPVFVRKRNIVLAIIAGVIIILAAVLVPVGVAVIAKKNSHSSTPTASSPSSTPSTVGGSGNGTSGTDGTAGGESPNSTPAYAVGTVLDVSTWYDKTDFNTTFTNATVGGLSLMGLNSTWDDTKRANARVPALNHRWNYSEIPMRGVNLGGWLIVEPFITPSLFDSYPTELNIVDEYSLSKHLDSEAKSVLEKHYATFITEQDFKQISDVGLDHVRIPFPYWTVEALRGDPYVSKVSWRYLLRGIEWARKYGLRVKLDLHSVPGNANGWNHSGRQGQVEFLNGTHGDYYGNVTLELHGKMAEFFAQDRYKNVVALYGLVNEPNMMVLDGPKVIEWTGRAYDLVRSKGLDAYIVFGDGFRGAATWYNVFPQDRYPGMVLDLHQYMIFNTGLIAQTHTSKIDTMCNGWSQIMEISSNNMTGHGPTMVGEWSQADTDCLRYLNNINVGSRWEGTYNVSVVANQVLVPSCPGAFNCTCTQANASPDDYSDEYREYLLTAAEAQMHAFESNGGWGFMYWAWKMETPEATQWSYQRAVAANIMPRQAYQRQYNCSASVDFVAMGLADNY